MVVKAKRLRCTDNTEYMTSRLGDVHGHPDYNRSQDSRRARRFFGIAFRRRYAGTIICVMWQGRRTCVDGMDRLIRLKEMYGDDYEIVIMMVHGLQPHEIHELFIASNIARTRASAFDRFRHLYAAGHCTQQSLVGIAAVRGFHIPVKIAQKNQAYGAIGLVPYSGMTVDKAYDALTKTFESYGAAVVGAIFSVIKDCFRVNPLEVEKAAKTPEFISGLAVNLARNPKVSAANAAFRAAKANATEILAEATARCNKAQITGRKARNHFVGQVIDDIFNGRPWQVTSKSVP